MQRADSSCKMITNKIIFEERRKTGSNTCPFCNVIGYWKFKLLITYITYLGQKKERIYDSYKIFKNLKGQKAVIQFFFFYKK